jgi:hypothetical protein
MTRKAGPAEGLSRIHELGLLRSVRKNLFSEDKRKLQAYYQQHKTIEPGKFRNIISERRRNEANYSEHYHHGIDSGDASSSLVRSAVVVVAYWRRCSLYC